MKKILIFFSILIVTLALLAGCAADEPSEEMSTELTTVAEEALPVFTLEELSKFDGQNGNPVYVGYEGKVYDVSNVEEWKTGTHRGRIKAGQDLTDVLNNEAPHSSQRLKDNAPVVGILE